jgi:hypothetical protein
MNIFGLVEEMSTLKALVIYFGIIFIIICVVADYNDLYVLSLY